MCNFEEKNQRFIFWTSLLALREAQTLPTPTPPEKKKKKEKKKNYPSFTPFKNWRKDTTLVFITSILKSLLILVIGLALIGAIYSQEAPFSSKLHLSPTQWNWKNHSVLQIPEDQLSTR